MVEDLRDRRLEPAHLREHVLPQHEDELQRQRIVFHDHGEFINERLPAPLIEQEKEFLELVQHDDDSGCGAGPVPVQQFLQRNAVRIESARTIIRYDPPDHSLHVLQRIGETPDDTRSMALVLQPRDDAGPEDRTLANAGTAVEEERAPGKDAGADVLDLLFAAEEQALVVLGVVVEELVRTGRLVFVSLWGRFIHDLHRFADEDVPMLRHRFDVTGIRRVILQLLPDRLDTLGQRRIADDHVLPDFVKDAVLLHKLSRIGYQQHQHVEIPGTQRQHGVFPADLAVLDIQHEIVEAEAFGGGLLRHSGLNLRIPTKKKRDS